MPVGVARRAEPYPGVAVDRPVLLLGVVGIVVAVVAFSALAAAVIARRARLRATHAPRPVPIDACPASYQPPPRP